MQVSYRRKRFRAITIAMGENHSDAAILKMIGDFNQDGLINVVDIIQLVNIILNN